MKETEINLSPVVCFGEILWDILPDGPQPGGAPLNVAYHLSKLGVVTSIVSRIGNDSNGSQLGLLLDNWGIKKSLLQKDNEHSTSTVIAKMNNGNEVSYEIKFPAAWDFINEPKSIVEHLNPTTYFIYGSLSSRNDISKNTLFKILESDAIKVFDINLRPPYVNRELLEALLFKADIVKFNEAELEMAQLLFGGSFGHEASRVKFIQHHFSIREVIVTKGEFGASYYKNDESWHVWGTEIKVRDTIGSGDSFLAAFIANHYKQIDPQNTIKNAASMGAFIATKKGGCPQYKIEEYLNFKNQAF